MIIRELIEGIGKNDYHPESFYAPLVADLVNNEGLVYWNDIYNHIEDNVDLNGADLTPSGKDQPARWKKILANLHANRTLEGGRFGNIVRIKGGFATARAARELGVDVLPDNAAKKRNPGKRQPINIERKTGEIVGKAYGALGKPALRNSSKTRKAIESMIKSDPWLPDEELVSMAQDIITAGIK